VSRKFYSGRLKDDYDIGVIKVIKKTLSSQLKLYIN